MTMKSTGKTELKSPLNTCLRKAKISADQKTSTLPSSLTHPVELVRGYHPVKSQVTKIAIDALFLPLILFLQVFPCFFFQSWEFIEHCLKDLPPDFIFFRFNSHCNSSTILCRTIQYKRSLLPYSKLIRQLLDRKSR